MALVTSPLGSLVFDANGCTRQYTLINAGQTNLLYILKCNNPNTYQFKPTEGLIAAGEVHNIEITRKV
ncbi:hypothetical protein Y032_0267g766 [Ancylostoma ceylanicum]|nr:hypothetical protein Y032_0267g766 [Ancylostoma ceylanicum]